MKQTMMTMLVLLAFGAAAPARGADEPDAGELFGMAIDAHRKLNVISAERQAALGHRPIAQGHLRQIVAGLKKADGVEMILKQLDLQIASLEDRIKTMTKFKAAPEALARQQAELTWARRTVTALRLTDADQRNAELDKAEAELAEVDKQIKTIGAPFDQRRRAVTDAVAPHAEALTKLIRGHMTDPAGAFASKMHRCHVTIHDGFASCDWRDADNKQVAWAHLRIRDQSEIPDHAGTNLLDDKYPIQAEADFHLWVWAGNVLVTFVPNHEDLRNKNVLKQQIGRFIHLEDLASIEPKPVEPPVADEPADAAP